MQFSTKMTMVKHINFANCEIKVFEIKSLQDQEQLIYYTFQFMEFAINRVRFIIKVRASLGLENLSRII